MYCYPFPDFILHATQGGDDAGVCLLTVGMYARPVHRPAKSDDNIILGHAILVLVVLSKKGKGSIVSSASHEFLRKRKIAAHLKLPHSIVSVLGTDERGHVISGNSAWYNVLGGRIHACARGTRKTVCHGGDQMPESTPRTHDSKDLRESLKYTCA